MSLFLPIPWHCSGKGNKQGAVTASRWVRRLSSLIPAGLSNGEGVLLMQPRKCKEIQVCAFNPAHRSTPETTDRWMSELEASLVYTVSPRLKNKEVGTGVLRYEVGIRWGEKLG